MRALIIVSHDEDYLRVHCQRPFVLEMGVLHHFPDIESALEHRQQVMAA